MAVLMVYAEKGQCQGLFIEMADALSRHSIQLVVCVCVCAPHNPCKEFSPHSVSAMRNPRLGWFHGYVLYFLLCSKGIRGNVGREEDCL